MDMLLIGGLWMQPPVWDETAAALAEAGHRAVPVALPGQGDGDTDATLDDQLDAVLAAVDAAAAPPMVVGHSAAATLAWTAADRRPDTIARTALIGGFPAPDGQTYADFFPLRDGAMPFPGWAPFEGPDAADLDPAARARLERDAVPVPAQVARGIVRLRDERRFAVPVLMVCPEYTPAQAQQMIADGDVPELARAEHLEFADLDSGHWPMITDPAGLARILAAAAAPTP